MHLTLIPVRHDTRLRAERQGDVLILNGTAHDFSALPDGGEIPPGALDCRWIPEPVRRVDGGLLLSLLLPHGADAPAASRHPAPLILTQDGPVDLPPYGTAGAAD